MIITPTKDLYSEDGVKMFTKGKEYEIPESSPQSLGPFTSIFNDNDNIHTLGDWSYHFAGKTYEPDPSSVNTPTDNETERYINSISIDYGYHDQMAKKQLREAFIAGYQKGYNAGWKEGYGEGIYDGENK